MDPYNEAHIFVAALRVMQHNSNDNRIEGVCELLNMSTEAGLSICRRLEKLGIVKTMQDPFSLRVAVEDHLAIEKLPRQREQGDQLARELQAFRAKKRDMDSQVESIQEELARKRKSMFSDLEKKLKAEIQRKK